MNAERLHAIARAIQAELRSTGQVELTRRLRDSLANAASNPQDPASQQQIASALQSLEAVLPPAESNQFAPTWTQVIEELGFGDLLGNRLLDRVQAIMQRNQLTPSIAAEAINPMADGLGELETQLQGLIAGFGYLRIGAEELAPQEAEVGILIPRAAVSSSLRELGEEFVELNRILGPFLEIATGERPTLEVSTISSSDFGVFVDMLPEAAVLLAVAMDKLLDAYKKVLEVRTLREGLRAQGMSPGTLNTVDEEVNSVMAKATKEIAESILISANRSDDGRINELRVDLGNSLNAIANRIDEGYSIDVRASATVAGDDTTETRNDAIRVILEVSPRLKYITPAGNSILALPEGREDVPPGEAGV